MRFRALLCLLVTVGVPAAARAADCPGHPDALGTSRVLVVDPTEHPRIGIMQYRDTLPLADHEVVLTFDDGPLLPFSRRVLETLDAQCVKATYFMVGRMAAAYPAMVREIAAAGHTIGTHSENHPLRFEHMTLAQVQKEVDDGIASVKAALGDGGTVAPFFRIPGLLRAETPERYLASQSIMTWSADFPADDWHHISAAEVLHKALTRLEIHHKGVLLLHDIHARTALMLPTLLRELKKRGYRIVQVVPATPDRPKTPTTPDQWIMDGAHVAGVETWPSVGIDMEPVAAGPELPAPSPQNFGIADTDGTTLKVARPASHPRPRLARGQVPLPPQSMWPRDAAPPAGLVDGGLPAPSRENFGYGATAMPAPAMSGPTMTAPAVSAPAAATASTPAPFVLPPPTTVPPGPRADITGTISAQARPLTTAEMPKSGIP